MSTPLVRQARLEIKRLSEKAVLPVQGSALAAGLDLSSAADLVIKSGARALVPTDLSIACPPGTYGRIAPRSGLAYKKGIDVGGTWFLTSRARHCMVLLVGSTL
jgi:deoxyuridine 5'-triphosphate nucleotidohydrolase